MTWTPTLGPITRSTSAPSMLVCRVVYVSDQGQPSDTHTHTQPGATALANDIAAYTALLNQTDADVATLAQATVTDLPSLQAALVPAQVATPVLTGTALQAQQAAQAAQTAKDAFFAALQAVNAQQSIVATILAQQTAGATIDPAVLTAQQAALKTAQQALAALPWLPSYAGVQQ